MHNITFDQATMNVLARVFPLKGAIVVGAGVGQGPWFDFLSVAKVENVLLVEAQDDYAKQLERFYADHQNWRVKQQILSGRNEMAPFYLLSNRNESGLLPAEQLKVLWPNISEKEQRESHTTTLDDIVGDFEANWLFVDCLPTLLILKGSEQQLLSSDLVVVRCLLEEVNASSTDSTVSLLDDFLLQKGFSCIGQEIKHHPLIGHRIYLRDYRGELCKLQVQYQQQQKQICQLTVQGEGQARLAAERLVEIEQISKKRDEQSQLSVDRQERIDQLRKQCDEHDKLTQENEVLKCRVSDLENVLKLNEEKLGLQKDKLCSDITTAEGLVGNIKKLLEGGSL